MNAPKAIFSYRVSFQNITVCMALHYSRINSKPPSATINIIYLPIP